MVTISSTAPKKQWAAMVTEISALKDAGFLAFTQNAFDYVKVFHQKVMRKLAKKLRAMPEFSLEDDGQDCGLSPGIQGEEKPGGAIFLADQLPGPVSCAPAG